MRKKADETPAKNSGDVPDIQEVVIVLKEGPGGVAEVSIHKSTFVTSSIALVALESAAGQLADSLAGGTRATVKREGLVVGENQSITVRYRNGDSDKVSIISSSFKLDAMALICLRTAMSMYEQDLMAAMQEAQESRIVQPNIQVRPGPVGNG